MALILLSSFTGMDISVWHGQSIEIMATVYDNTCRFYYIIDFFGSSGKTNINGTPSLH